MASSCRKVGRSRIDTIRNWLYDHSVRSHSQGARTIFSHPSSSSAAITSKITYNRFGFQGNRISLLYFTRSWDYVRKDQFARYSSFQQASPPPPPSSQASPNISWKRWILGMVMMFILSFFGHKTPQFLLLKKEVDTAMETAEEIVDVVEVVAEIVDKVAEDIAGDLPEGGKLRKAVDIDEDAAEKIAKDAHAAGEFLDKVEDIEEKLEAIVEPVKHLTKEGGTLRPKLSE